MSRGKEIGLVHGKVVIGKLFSVLSVTLTETRAKLSVAVTEQVFSTADRSKTSKIASRI